MYLLLTERLEDGDGDKYLVNMDQVHLIAGSEGGGCRLSYADSEVFDVAESFEQIATWLNGQPVPKA